MMSKWRYKVSRIKLEHFEELIQKGVLWIQLTTWFGNKAGKTKESDIPFMKDWIKDGKVLPINGKRAFFRPVRKDDIEYIRKHEELGDDKGMNYAKMFVEVVLKKGMLKIKKP